MNRWIGILLIALCVMPSPLRAAEPRVSAEESDLIESARMLGEEGRHTEALALVRGSAGPSSSAAVDFVLGNLHAQVEEWGEAENAYRAALQKDPEFTQAQGRLLMVLLAQHRGKDAVEEAKRLLQKDDLSTSQYMLAGAAYLLEGHTIGAETAFRQALLKDPSESAALEGLADTLIAQQRYPEAEVLLARLLEEDPGRTVLWLARADLALAMGQTLRALVCLETAYRLGALDQENLWTLGDLRLSEGQSADAVKAYQEALSLTGSEGQQKALDALERLLQSGDTEQAVAWLNHLKGSEKLPDLENSVRLCWAEAELARMHEDWNAALAGYQSVVRQEPLNAKALLRLGDVYVVLNRLEDAELTYERAGRIEGFEAKALIGRARIQVQRGDYTQAVSLLEDSQALDPQKHVAQYLERIQAISQSE
ncbi:MAG: tetratricopeptide repeat protein [Candidatus Omnitrophica bacterium]|nr:tetratricopeptide repeat protein [Candidatus Omnitrophota bacterium]